MVSGAPGAYEGTRASDSFAVPIDDTWVTVVVPRGCGPGSTLRVRPRQRPSCRLDPAFSETTIEVAKQTGRSCSISTLRCAALLHSSRGQPRRLRSVLLFESLGRPRRRTGVRHGVRALESARGRRQNRYRWVRQRQRPVDARRSRLGSGCYCCWIDGSYLDDMRRIATNNSQIFEDCFDGKPWNDVPTSDQAKNSSACRASRKSSTSRATSSLKRTRLTKSPGLQR